MKTSEALRKKKREVIINVGFKLICALERFTARLSPVGDHNIFPPDQFEWASAIEANWKTIRQELQDILKYRDKLPNFQDISEDQRQFTTDDKWKTYFLYCFGHKSESNCRRCPETTKLIEKVSGRQTVFFSILSPHKHIPKHRGIYKGLIRYHLGLIIPQPNTACRIQIGEDITCWEEGKSLIFDDTYPHQVWNNTDGERVVLLMDVMRPFPFPLSALNKLIVYLISLSPFVQDGIKNEMQWEKAFHGMVEYP